MIHASRTGYMVNIFLPIQSKWKIEHLGKEGYDQLHICYDCSDEEAQTFADSLEASIIEKSAM